MSSPGTKRSLLAQERSRDTRKAIVKAALELWSERGYATGIDDTRAEEIAARAGVSKATFYLHFARKDDILLETGWATTTVFYDDAVTALGAVSAGAPRGGDEVLDEVTVRLCRRMEKVPREVLRRILRAQASAAEPGAGETDTERFGFRRAFTLIFERAQEPGSGSWAVSATDLGGIFEAMLYESLREWAYDEDADLLSMLRQRFAILVTGARAVPAPALPGALRRGSPSCRSFAADPVPRDLLERIIEAARWAGSARNAQPWRFAAVTGAASRETLSRLGAYAQHLAGAPLVLVVLEPSSGGRDTQFDLGRVTQNITLAAQSLGLGSCVATFYPEENASAAAAAAGFGSDWNARHAIAIGWPAPSAAAGRSAIPGGRLPVSELLRWHDGP